MAKQIKTWPRETVTLVGGKTNALLGYATAVMLDGVETVISAPTMEGLEKVYAEIVRLDDDGVMEEFDPSLCQAIAYLPRTGIAVDLDL
jgi:hypothetical protein